MFPYPVCHSVTYLLPLFLYVAIAGLLHQNHWASLLGTAVPFLSDTSVISLSSFQQPGSAVQARKKSCGEILLSIVCWRHGKVRTGWRRRGKRYVVVVAVAESWAKHGTRRKTARLLSDTSSIRNTNVVSAHVVIRSMERSQAIGHGGSNVLGPTAWEEGRLPSYLIYSCS